MGAQTLSQPIAGSCRMAGAQSSACTEEVFAQTNSHPWSVPIQRGVLEETGTAPAQAVDTGECSRFHLERGCLNRTAQLRSAYVWRVDVYTGE